MNVISPLLLKFSTHIASLFLDPADYYGHYSFPAVRGRDSSVLMNVDNRISDAKRNSADPDDQSDDL